MNEWQPIETAPKDGTRVSLWMDVYASPRSMGWADHYAVRDCWMEGRDWVHVYRGKPARLYNDYATHWAPSGANITAGPSGESLEWWSESSPSTPKQGEGE